MNSRLNVGHLVAAAGAVLLFASLFVDWFEVGPRDGVTAWTVFELVDVLLALLALATVVAVAGDVLERARSVGAERWLPALGGAALLLVVVSIVNNPPAVTGSGEEAGAWLALAGAVLMALGAFVGERRISITVSSSKPRREPTAGPGATDREPRATSPERTGPAFDPKGSETETRPINPVDRRP